MYTKKKPIFNAYIMSTYTISKIDNIFNSNEIKEQQNIFKSHSYRNEHLIISIEKLIETIQCHQCLNIHQNNNINLAARFALTLNDFPMDKIQISLTFTFLVGLMWHSIMCPMYTKT